MRKDERFSINIWFVDWLELNERNLIGEMRKIYLLIDVY